MFVRYGNVRAGGIHPRINPLHRDRSVCRDSMTNQRQVGEAEPRKICCVLDGRHRPLRPHRQRMKKVTTLGLRLPLVSDSW